MQDRVHVNECSHVSIPAPPQCQPQNNDPAQGLPVAWDGHRGEPIQKVLLLVCIPLGVVRVGPGEPPTPERPLSQQYQPHAIDTLATSPPGEPGNAHKASEWRHRTNTERGSFDDGSKGKSLTQNSRLGTRVFSEKSVCTRASKAGSPMTQFSTCP